MKTPDEPQLMTQRQVVASLAATVQAAGGIRAWSRATALSHGNVSAVLAHKRPPYPALLKAMGLARAVAYRALRK